MSYQEREVKYVGRYFYNSEELVNFLLNHHIVSQELVNKWKPALEDGETITNLLSPSDILTKNFPQLERVDSISGDASVFLGYIINSPLISLEGFNANIEEAKNKWKNIFNEDVELQSIIQYV